MKFNIQHSGSIASLAIVFIALSSSTCFSQGLSLEQAVQSALQNNQRIKSSEYNVEYFRQVRKTSTDIGKLSAVWMHGQYNSIVQDNNLTFTQNLPFPTTLGAQIKLGKAEVTGAEKNLVATQNNLVFEVKSVYEQLVFQQAMMALLHSQDSLYEDFAKASALRYKTGESNLLEKTTAETQLLEVRNLLRINEADIQISRTRLQALLNTNTPVAANDALIKRTAPEVAVSYQNNPELNYLKQQVSINEQFRKVERNRILPDLAVGYYNQTLVGVQNINGQDKYYGPDKRFQGFTVGLAIPLWLGPHVARSKAAAFREEATRKEAEYFETTLNGTFTQALQELDKNSASLNYYETSALKNAELIIAQSRKAYRGGEIGYVEYLQALKSALSIKANYLLALTQYNQSVIKLEFLLGKF